MDRELDEEIALGEIAGLTHDFDFPGLWLERVREVNRGVIGVLVPHSQMMWTGGEGGGQ